MFHTFTFGRGLYKAPPSHQQRIERHIQFSAFNELVLDIVPFGPLAPLSQVQLIKGFWIAYYSLKKSDRWYFLGLSYLSNVSGATVASESTAHKASYTTCIFASWVFIAAASLTCYHFALLGSVWVFWGFISIQWMPSNDVALDVPNFSSRSCMNGGYQGVNSFQEIWDQCNCASSQLL